MKKITIIFMVVLLFLTLSACKQETNNSGKSGGLEETSMNDSMTASNTTLDANTADSSISGSANSSTGINNMGNSYYNDKSVQKNSSSPPQKSTGSGIQAKHFSSIEAFTEYMKNTNFEDDKFFSGSDSSYEQYYMLRADKYYILPKVTTSNTKLKSIFIYPGGLMKFSYDMGDGKTTLNINIPTRKERKLDGNEKSLLSMAKEITAGYAPDVIWSSYSISGEEMALSNENEIVLLAGDYLVTMYVMLETNTTAESKFERSIKDHVERVTFEKVSLK